LVKKARIIAYHQRFGVIIEGSEYEGRNILEDMFEVVNSKMHRSRGRLAATV